MTPGALGFAHPWALLGLLAAVPAVWLLRRRRRRLPGILLPEGAAARAIRPSAWARLWWLPSALVIAALVLTSIGLAGPRLRASRRQDLSVEGIDIVVAFDLSTSMLAADFRPKDRITVAKEVLRNFIGSRPCGKSYGRPIRRPTYSAVRRWSSPGANPSAARAPRPP